jgi:hypothetical protein
MMIEQSWKVDLEADLNAREADGYCWSALSDAPDPTLIQQGAVVVAGDSDAPALVEIIDLKPVGNDVMVRFRILPGLIEDYEASLTRSRISA